MPSLLQLPSYYLSLFLFRYPPPPPAPFNPFLCLSSGFNRTTPTQYPVNDFAAALFGQINSSLCVPVQPVTLNERGVSVIRLVGCNYRRGYTCHLPVLLRKCSDKLTPIFYGGKESLFYFYFRNTNIFSLI